MILLARNWHAGAGHVSQGLIELVRTPGDSWERRNRGEDASVRHPTIYRRIVCVGVHFRPSVRPSQLEEGTAHWRYSTIDGHRQRPETSALGVIEVAVER